jgi:alpha-amylase
METAWVDLSSGNYEGEQTARLSAISESANAQLVYTLDGTNPTANSAKVSSGSTITIPIGTTTLKVGLLIGGVISGIVSRQYEVTEEIPFNPYAIHVYVNTDKVGWNRVNFWTWGGDGSHAPKNGNWPGDAVTTTVSIGGKNWYRSSYTINSLDDCVNLVFSTNSGSPQTIDINDVKQDAYFEISNETDGGKNKVNDLTNQLTAVNRVLNDAQQKSEMYNIQGMKVKNNVSLPHGIYIQNGKKVVVK